MNNSAKKDNYGIFLITILIFIFSIFFVSCDKIDFLKPKQPAAVKQQTAAPVVKGTVIAKVDSLPITLEELERQVTVYNGIVDSNKDWPEEQKKAARIDTREKKFNYLKDLLIRQAVFYQAALDRGLDRKPEIGEILERYKIAFLAQEMQNEIIKNVDIGSAVIEEAYNNNKSLFKEPESRKVREIVTKAEEEAKQALIELLQGGDFASIARSRSIADSAKNGGDLGFIRRGQRGEQYLTFDEIVFSPALQEGSLSNVFKGPDGYYIVKIEGIKEGKQVSLSEAWDTVKAFLLARKQKEELDKVYSQLYREHKIEIYEGQIK
jgi:peptidyl-prolyl cis-trans isomerase C